MKLLAALLLITPVMLTTAHAAGDGDNDRRSRVQRSIYDVNSGQYRTNMYEGRASTMGAPRERLGPGGSNDPEYFVQENNNRY
jgi:hypothetical protein